MQRSPFAQISLFCCATVVIFTPPLAACLPRLNIFRPFSPRLLIRRLASYFTVAHAYFVAIDLLRPFTIHKR